MSETSIGPPERPVNRSLESQLEDVHLVEVVRAKAREVEMNDREAAKQRIKMKRKHMQKSRFRSKGNEGEKASKPNQVDS